MRVSKTNLVNERVQVMEGACQGQSGLVRAVFQDDDEVRFVVELENGQILQKAASCFRVLRESATSVERDLFG